MYLWEWSEYEILHGRCYAFETRKDMYLTFVQLDIDFLDQQNSILTQFALLTRTRW